MREDKKEEEGRGGDGDERGNESNPCCKTTPDRAGDIFLAGEETGGKCQDGVGGIEL